MLVAPDVHPLIDQLTLEEKASLSIGSGFWTTRAIDRLGIPQIVVSDGPHGVRRQPDGADHIGLSGSMPATCFPTAAGRPRSTSRSRRGTRWPSSWHSRG
jgi:beta-glucosidase